MYTSIHLIYGIAQTITNVMLDCQLLQDKLDTDNTITFPLQDAGQKPSTTHLTEDLQKSGTVQWPSNSHTHSLTHAVSLPYSCSIYVHLSIWVRELQQQLKSPLASPHHL